MKQNRHQSALDWFNNEFVHENSNQIVLIYNHLYNNMLCMPSFIILFFYCSGFFCRNRIQPVVITNYLLIYHFTSIDIDVTMQT